MTILRRGDIGAAVRELQRLLRVRGAKLEQTAAFDADTYSAVWAAQTRYGLVVDGIAGPKTMLALQLDGKHPNHLGAADLARAAQQLGVRLAAVRALNEVESNGAGFLTDERPKILFERHIMYRQLHAAGMDAAGLAGRYPNIVNPKAGGYLGGTGEHMRLAQAADIDLTCAVESSSWGSFQIMGFHWKRLGYASALEYADTMRLGEAQQLDAFVRFIATDAALLKALKALKWSTVAEIYNGEDYKTHLYDVRLARAFERYAEDEKVAA
ncbi:N-acetylmuramidase domain-containing protein [Cupriavidus plantarum]|uniref:N-acetylmuramidase domain-containing protein n=1 Tax=Cupriavidus plantarum TaxID=942865 RepID=UPI000E280FF8|nr:N-acetylmuramidase domain-containing protein [Cupriavidus plantarum]REE92644.1 peptidoglycan hydrolase-like protein with peptidoglycan-binding domain [Cupriavidus plantarum]